MMRLCAKNTGRMLQLLIIEVLKNEFIDQKGGTGLIVMGMGLLCLIIHQLKYLCSDFRPHFLQHALTLESMLDICFRIIQIQRADESCWLINRLHKLDSNDSISSKQK